MIDFYFVFFSGHLPVWFLSSGKSIPPSDRPCSFTGRPPADSVYFGSSPLFFPFWNGRHGGRVGSICLGRPSALGFRPERGVGDGKKKWKRIHANHWREGELFGKKRSKISSLLAGCICWINASLPWGHMLPQATHGHATVYSLEWAPETSRQLGGDARPCQAIMSFMRLCQGYAEDKLSSPVALRNPEQNKNRLTGREQNLVVVGVSKNKLNKKHLWGRTKTLRE